MPVDLEQEEGLAREERGVGPAEFVRRLVREGRRARVPQPLRREPADPDPSRRRMTWAAELLKREALAFLTRSGGWRRRLVVVGGRRREARVWEAPAWEALDVRFGPAALLLLEAAMREPEALPAIGPELAAAAARAGTGDLLALHLVVEPLLTAEARSRRRSGAAEREPQALGQRLEALLKALGPPGRQVTLAAQEGAVLGACGDPQYGPGDQAARWVEKAAAGEPHTWIDLGPWARGVRLFARRWPAQGLTLLMAVSGSRRSLDLDSGEVRAALDGLEAALPALRPVDDRERTERRRALLRLSPLTLLLRPQELGELAPEAAAAALLSLFQGDRPALLTWLDEALAGAWLEEEARRQALPPAEVGAAWEAAGRGLLALAEAAAERPDALRPLLRFYDRYLVRHGTRAPVVQGVQARAEALDRASDRDALRRSAASLFAPGRLLTAAGERALGRAFVDRSEAERAFLVEYHEVWRQIGPEVEAIRRELAGEVG